MERDEQKFAKLYAVEANARRASTGTGIEAVCAGIRINGRWQIACQGKRATGATLAEAVARLGVCDE